MKKALSVFLMLALVGSVFAAEPVADVNIAEFKGEASVQWGVDLDTMKTGFKNSADVTLKLNLLNEGSKSTTGDGVWGELVIKTNGDTFAKATNSSNIALPAMNVVVDTAKIHFGPAYVGITSGNTKTGELKMDAAIRSADNNNGKWLSDVGPGNFSQGITLGYNHDMFNVAADIRSYNETVEIWKIEWQASSSAFYTDALNPSYRGSETAANELKKSVEEFYKERGEVVHVNVAKVGDYHGIDNQYTHAYAFALEGEVKPVENLSIKAGVSYNFNKEYYKTSSVEVGTPIGNTLGYSASAGYKMALNDTFYLRPQVGFTGKNVLSNKNDKGEYIVAGGLLFGWGEIGIDDNAGVYFLDDDNAKKVSPGVGVVVKAPIAEDEEITIAPSFFSGDIIPGLTAAAYSEIIVPTAENAKLKFAVSNGVKYAIPVAAGTITPQLGVRYANAAYDEAADDTLKLKAGVEVGGFVSNTTFFTVYESGDLIADEAGIGTLNFGAKISF